MVDKCRSADCWSLYMKIVSVEGGVDIFVMVDVRRNNIYQNC